MNQYMLGSMIKKLDREQSKLDEDLAGSQKSEETTKSKLQAKSEETSKSKEVVKSKEILV